MNSDTNLPQVRVVCSVDAAEQRSRLCGHSYLAACQGVDTYLRAHFVTLHGPSCRYVNVDRSNAPSPFHVLA